jgi:cytochrome c oxidase subunit II
MGSMEGSCGPSTNTSSATRARGVALLALLGMVGLSGTVAAHAAGAVDPLAYDRLLAIVLVIGAAVAGLVFALILLGLWRFREHSDYPRAPPKEHDRRLESAWTAAPIVIIVVLAALSTQAMIQSETPPEDALTVRVAGIQWQWVFTYPDGNTSIDDLWIEEGQHVIFEVTSLDVVHSFFLPQFNLKVDAFPNQTYRTWIHADRVGDYDIFCAEFCGLEHGEMQGTLHIYARTTPSRPYGPPPDQQPPPPPPPANVTVTLGVDGSGTGPVELALSPRVLTVPLNANVTLVVRNNTTVALDVRVGPPYLLSLTGVGPGEQGTLEFRSDRPAAGGSIEVRGRGGEGAPANATLIVGAGSGGVPYDPNGGTEGQNAFAWALALGAVTMLLAVLGLALREPRPEVAVPQDGGPGAQGGGGPQGGGAHG